MMCIHCIKNPTLDRGRLCSDSGALLSNLVACFSCGKDRSQTELLSVPVANPPPPPPAETATTTTALETSSEREEEEEEEEAEGRRGVELSLYQHVCSHCRHIVAEHRHEFWVEGDYQEYRMDCLLCGTGEDSVSVMPRDPRKVSEW